MKSVNSSMLVLARESRGLSQTQLAGALGISQGKLSKYETGMLRVSDVDLLQLARVLRYHRDLFVHEACVYSLGSSNVFNRRYKSAPVSMQKKVQARINVARLQIERLLQATEIDHLSLFQRTHLAELDGRPAKTALQIRELWRVPRGPIPNLTALVENAGGIVCELDFETPTIDATHFWVPGVAPMFFLNSQTPQDRRRFSLAHEIGHAVMHQVASEDAENEANEFAAEFLMPRESISAQLQLLTIERAAQLKATWRVSIQALVRRAFEVRAISERRYKDLNRHISARGERMIEPFPITEETASIRERLIDLHRRELGYSDSQIQQLLFEAPSAHPFDVVAAPRTIQFPRVGRSDEGPDVQGVLFEA
ncbi:MAG: XRE family transcriptional regulator [Phycisphaerae bacterium]